MKKAPLFITFEGGEGCGKTTQMALFCEWLFRRDTPFMRTREPGGTPVGKEIRKLLLEGAGDKFDALSELFLFSADRHEHMRTIIQPALARGEWVISDRFADSTTVYQSHVKGLDAAMVEQVHQWATGGVWPHLTFILDIPVAEGLARKGKQAEEGLTETRMEGMGQSFHEKVRQGYLAIAQQHPSRCRVIDASGTINDVQQRLRDALTAFLA
ncbi:MAG: dTMP kinase [Alphaproteobacteria bacterium]